MRRLCLVLTIACLTIGTGWAQTTTPAAPAAAKPAAAAPMASGIGTIDFMSAVLETEEGTKVKAQLEKETTAKETELDKMKKDYEALGEKLRAATTDSARTDLTTQIKNAERKLKFFQEDAMQILQESQAKLLDPVVARVRKAINAVAVEEGLVAVWDKQAESSNIVYSPAGADITAQVIRWANEDAAKNPAAAAKPQ